MDLLTSLFRELLSSPDRLVKAHLFPILRLNDYGPHAHEDILQFDLALNCTGAWVVDGEAWRVQGPTAAVFHPRHVHQYQLLPASRAGGRVLSLKLRVDADMEGLARQIFVPCRAQLRGEGTLVLAFERLIRVAADAASLPMRMVRLQETLCLWPALHEKGVRPGAAIGDVVIEAAMSQMEAQLQRRPDLSALAEEAGLSPRQFARRFALATGLSPIAWANQRRLQWAGELLEEPGVAVKQVAAQLGFDSPQSFSRWFHQGVGRAPSAVLRTRR